MKKKSEQNSRIDILREISKGVGQISAISSMSEEIVVPTMVTSYNRATGLGGHPLRRFVVVHGPNHSGKSVLGLAIAESMRRAGHISVVFDTEFAAEKSWYSDVTIGDEILFKMPESLDELIGDVQHLLDNLEALKKAGKLSPDVGCCFVVDTLTKLMPSEILEKIREEGVSKSYPLQAMWLSIWSKSIIPLIYRTNSTMLCVLQERTNQGAKPFQKQYTVTGGQSLMYDASLRIRVDYGKSVKVGDSVVGMQSFFTVEKNKADGSSLQKGSFFTSNGEGDAPRGLDYAREAFNEAKDRGVVKKIGGEYIFGRGEPFLKIGGGAEAVINHLRDDANDFSALVEYLNREARGESSC